MIGALPRSLAEVDRFLQGVIEAGAEPTPELDSVETYASAWTAAGLRVGDLVLLAMSNTRLMLTQMFAILAAGGVPAIAPASLPSARLRRLARGFGARAIGSSRCAPLAGADVERLGPIAPGVEAAWLPRGPGPAIAPGDIVLLTSGTSGVQSGCVHGFDALVRNATKHADAIGVRADDVMLVTLPLHYSYALVAQVLAAFVRSARLVLAAPPFKPLAYRETIAGHGITVSSITPVLLQALVTGETVVDRRLRVLTVGGDALAPASAGRWLSLHPHAELYATYGLTEAGPRVSTLAVHAEPEHRWASVGRPLPETWITLGDEDEVLVSSDTLMKRRIGEVEERRTRDWRAPGVLPTGDVGVIDADGYLYVRGRLSEFLIIGGEKVLLGSVRRLAAELPGVLRAETPLVRDARGTHYELVLHVESTAASADSLQRQLLRQLRPSERPCAIRVVAATTAVVSSFK